MLTVSAIRGEGFALLPVSDAAAPTVKLSGNADAAAVAPLERFLKQLHNALVDARSAEVHVDLVELYFMNSSCVRAFASWICTVRATANPYRVRLQMNGRQAWQHRSLEPIRRLAPTVVVMEQCSDRARID